MASCTWAFSSHEGTFINLTAMEGPHMHGGNLHEYDPPLNNKFFCVDGRWAWHVEFQLQLASVIQPAPLNLPRGFECLRPCEFIFWN